MRDYLDRMGAPTQLPAPDVAYPRIIGANGPKMLALAGEITDGAMPALQPPAFTAQARQVLGPNKLLAVFMHANLEQGDAAAIAATVREHLAAGADHVMAGAPIGTDFAVGVDRLEQLAPVLSELP